MEILENLIRIEAKSPKALAAVKADILRGEYRFKSESKIRFEDFGERYLEYGKMNKKKSWIRD